MEQNADTGASAESTTSTVRQEESPSTTSPAKEDDVNEPVSARRAKAMSIGNAASLFGASDDAASLFGGGSGGDTPNKPASMAQSPFETIGEESEEQAKAVRHDNAASSTSASNVVAQSPSDDAAALFGDAGQTPPVEWLGGAATNTNDADASNLFSDISQSQTVAAQDSSLYASGQSGSAQYGYDYSASGQEAYAYQQQDQHQYAQYAGQAQQQSQYSQYTPQGVQQQAYGQYAEPAVDNFNQSMYYDPTQQLQYEQSLQAQAHLQNQPAPSAYNGHPQADYNQQQYPLYGDLYASPGGGQDQYASYYGQQPYSSQIQQQSSQQTASAYQSQNYLQAQQSYTAPYSAPAGPAATNQLAQSQTSRAGKSHYAPQYSQNYDPYAPSHDPYAQPLQPQQPSGHSKQTSISSSKTSPNLGSFLQPTNSQNSAAKQDPKLNRSASSFFAELPPMPAKSRPTSAIGSRSANSSIPPVPPMAGSHHQAMPPPPPKSKSPTPLYNQPRPSSRSTSAHPAQEYGRWSPSMSSSSHSRPGSRTAQRQGSLALTHSQPSQSDWSSTGSTQPQQYSDYAYGQSGPMSTQPFNAQPSAQYAGYNAMGQNIGMHSTDHNQASPPIVDRKSLDPAYGFHEPSEHAHAYPQAGAVSSQSRPQSRTSQQGSASTYSGQPAGLPPPKRAVTQMQLTDRMGSPGNPSSEHMNRQDSEDPAFGSRRETSKNKLGLADDDGMETLLNDFSKQRLSDVQDGDIPGTTETSLGTAIRTHLPASEPDTEPRLLSPQQRPKSALSEATRLEGANTTLSPQSGSVPLLSVSLPSPEVDKKPVSLPLDHDSVSDEQTQESETPSEVRSAEEELIRAEQEVKLEEDELDVKPSRAALAHSQGWQPSYTASDAYPEEAKPSPDDLQQAWSNDTYGVSLYDAPTLQQQGPIYDTHQQQAYWPDRESEYTSDVAHETPSNQPQQQHGNYESYDAYNQYSGSSAARAQAPYVLEAAQAGTAANQAYGYGQDSYVQNGHSQSQSSYQPYQPDTTTDHNSVAPGNQLGPQRPRNRPAVPIASFGFNGKLVTYFPTSATAVSASYGMYGHPANSVAPIKIQKLSELLPTESFGLDSFPGPLFMDSSATSASGKAKKKKELLAWLNVRIDESQQERNYLGAGAQEDVRARAEQKTVALQLLKLLLEHDGKLTGTPQLDQLVLRILVPDLTSTEHSSAAFTVAADLGNRVVDPPSTSTPQVTGRDLDTIQSHLIKGEKREAVGYALSNRLYTHALVIASGVDKALLAEVVKDFLSYELGEGLGGGRQPLRVAYSLLAGGGPGCINEFVSPRKALPNGHNVAIPSMGQSSGMYVTPPSRAPTPTGRPDYPSDVSPKVLSKWQETAAMIISNRSAGDQQALMSLGEVLSANAWFKAAHVCYLLSPLVSILGGPSVPGVRWTLLGAQDPLQDPISASDLEAIILTEIVEFAFSLVAMAKGQEAYIGLPHLQAYRVLHARYLADTGHHSKAQKYCDAIGATLKLATKRSPFYHATLLAQVKDLSDRLSMVSFQDKTGSWISRKVQRPTIDNVWSTLESRFAKFVTGDGEEDPAEEERKRKARDAAKGVAGPFAHYSSITPQGPEGLSRNGSYADLTMRATPPPQPTSVPNTISNANTTKATHHRRSSSYSYGPYGADPYGSYVPQMPQTTEEPEQHVQEDQGHQATANEPQYGYVTPQNDSGWWSNNNGGQEHSPYGSNSSYGQAPTFSPVTEGFESSNAEGLMSPMGFNHSPNMTSQTFQPQPSKLQQEVSKSTAHEEDDDDLGLGNNSARRRKEKSAADVKAEDPSTESEKKADAAKKEEATKQTTSGTGSWLGRIFRREGSASPTTGPIRAKLGEETSFVYDPVEKRWVNKKAGSDTPPPAATPPPPRAQTASPAGYSHAPASGAKSGTPPPPASRSTTATPSQAGLPPARSTPPPPTAVSASLPSAPPGPSSSLGSRPPSRAASVPTGELPPPPARKAGGGSAAAKKARSRYVDVLAQEQK